MRPSALPCLAGPRLALLGRAMPRLVLALPRLALPNLVLPSRARPCQARPCQTSPRLASPGREAVILSEEASRCNYAFVSNE
jgi:hypothetical protein